MGSYQVRPENTTGYSWNSHNAKRIQGKAVASDAIWGFFARETAQNGQFSGAECRYQSDRPDTLKKMWFAANHDNAYNALFPDGGP